MNKIAIIMIIAFLLIGISFAYAHGEEDFAKAEELIKQKIPCDKLSDEEFEIIGDYYMEQMHPGELHEIMDERMGGEGSESLRLTHINIARAFYCGEHGIMSTNIMNMMMGRNGMMNYRNPNYYSTNQNYDYFFTVILTILILVTLILLIFLLIRQSNKNERRKLR